MIEVKHVNKSFGKTQVLRDISTTFEKGKVNLIIGQSGHGKTVLAKCIVGLHEVDSGEILFDDRDFCKMNRVQRTAIRQEIGMLFQGSALFDSMTVEENVMFPLVMFKKMTKKEMLDRVNFCLERVNLTGRNALFPSECSGGMQKRIGIARAIAMNPKYLFTNVNNYSPSLHPREIDTPLHKQSKKYKKFQKELASKVSHNELFRENFDNNSGLNNNFNIDLNPTYLTQQANKVIKETTPSNSQIQENNTLLTNYNNLLQQ